MIAKLRMLTYRHQDWLIPGILAVATGVLFAAAPQERIASIATWTLANANWVGACLLAATTVGLILMGTTTAKRAGGCLVQGCIFVALMKANMPQERKTDVGQFVEAIGRQTEQRIAAKYEEMSRGVFAAADRR